MFLAPGGDRWLRRRVQSIGRTSATALVLALAVSGCGAGAEPLPASPAGVDELTVPTPSPDPADFVEIVDNPWLGATGPTVLEVAGDPSLTRTLTREARGEVIAGVVTTPFVSVDTTATGEEVRRVTNWLAQDRRGNVWWLGSETRGPAGLVAGESWRAGTAGAQAGLAMPARPRRGDGFVGYQTARGALLVSIIGLTGDASGRAVSWELTPPGASQPTAREVYRRGTGLIALIDLSGSGANAALREP